jgi:hypothetical protein
VISMHEKGPELMRSVRTRIQVDKLFGLFY